MSEPVVRPAGRVGRLAAPACVALTICLWASAFPAIRAGLRVYAPAELAALRFAFASLAFLLLCLASGRRVALPPAAHLPPILAAGFFGIFAYNLLLNTGELSVAAGPASFIINIGPIFTALLASSFLGERWPSGAWAGVLVSLAGVALIALANGASGASPLGALLLLAAAFCQSSQFVLQRPLSSHYGPVELTAFVIWSGTFFLLPLLPHGLVMFARTFSWSDASIAPIYLALMPGLLGYLCWTMALQHFGAAKASAFLYLVAPISMVIALLWLGEIPPPTAVAGGLTAIAGVILFNLTSRKAEPR